MSLVIRRGSAIGAAALLVLMLALLPWASRPALAATLTYADSWNGGVAAGAVSERSETNNAGALPVVVLGGGG